MDTWPPLTYLFVPGNRPERFAKALASGADRVIIDLEDAVAPQDKAAARAAIAQWWPTAGQLLDKVLVRINDAASPCHADDMQLLASLQACAVMLPKCEGAGAITAVLTALPDKATVLALVETARGIQALPEIAAAPGTSRLAFGALDYMAELDLPATGFAVDHAAAQIAVASRAAGLQAPVAGITPDIDAARVGADALHARSLGFGAKLCIHPAQVAPALAALLPGAEEIAWAQRVLQAWAASGGSAFQLDGRMVDRPVALKAERIAALGRLYT